MPNSKGEPVHICEAWPLLILHRWGFLGPSNRRRRDTHFEPDGVFFYRPSCKEGSLIRALSA
jgi:hypothetical protein